MGATGRALRNVFRKKVRSITVVLIIGFCLGVYMAMSIVNSNISGRARDISQGSENQITIRPAGSFGGYGGFEQETMNETIIPKINSVDHIESVQKVITHMEGQMGQPGTGTRPTMVQGQDPSVALVLFGGGTLTITSGRTLNAGDANSNVALIGSGYSTNHGNVGLYGTITLNTTSLQVVGITSSGNRFGDDSVIIPYATAKRVYGISGMSMAYVYVDYAGNVDWVVSALKEVLGSEYDVVPASAFASQLQSSLNSIAASSETGLLLSLLTGVAVMIFIMILIARERTKEIGVLKAIGFKNSSIVGQFFTESVALAAIGLIVGVIVVMAAGPSIASALLGTSSSSNPRGPGGGPGGFTGGGIGGALVTRMSFDLQPDLIVTTLVLAILLGVVGSLYPIMKAIGLKPAEALRYE